MKRVFILFFIAISISANALVAHAATSFSADRSIIVASSSTGNAYVGGASVTIAAPITGDLSAIGGEVVITAPVSGDELLLAGSAISRASVEGDLRAVGGNITIEKPVAGDLVAFGLSVYDSGRAGGSVFIVALNSTVTNGASGPITIYGNNVSLAGNFDKDVMVITSGHLSLAEGTVIKGKLYYEAPEMASIPASAKVVGGVEYKNLSYLPNAGTSRTLALMSVGLFLLVRIFGALILAGLFTGLFPRLTQAVVDRAYTGSLRSTLLTTLLGFATLVATPILFVALLLTFVGIGIAIFIFIAYALVMFLALVYAGILLGGVFARRYAGRRITLWHEGVLGMLALSIFSLLPIIGPIVLLLITIFAAGALLLIFFDFSFPGEKSLP